MKMLPPLDFYSLETKYLLKNLPKRAITTFYSLDLKERVETGLVRKACHLVRVDIRNGI